MTQHRNSPDKPTRSPLSLKRGEAPAADAAPKLEERLHKVLAQAGLGSRRALEQRIADGLVKVNGEAALTGMSIKGGDRVELDGKVFVTLPWRAAHVSLDEHDPAFTSAAGFEAIVCVICA